MREVCRRCPLKQPCAIKSPEAPNGSRISSFSQCVHYTCTRGRKSAAKALMSDDSYLSFCDENGDLEVGKQFGTSHKPTHRSYSYNRRAVTDDGDIYTIDRRGRGKKTAVNIK